MATRIRSAPVRALSATLIVVGVLLAPIAVVASWARAELSDTDRFVSTFAPLAADPAVQGFVNGEVAAAINERLDLPALTSQLFEGLAEEGSSSRSASALALLEAPIAHALTGLVDDAVDRVVESGTFAEAWSDALRLSHANVTATLGGSPDARVELDGSGELSVQLGPIVEAVKTRLIEQGVPLANRIPAVDRSLVIAQSDSLPTVQMAYGLVIGVGLWLPWVALVLVVAGVLSAGLRRRAIIRSGIALGVVMLALSLALSIARGLLVTEAASSGVPPDAAIAVFAQLTASMRLSAIVIAVLAFTAAGIAWLSGDGALPRRIRGGPFPGVAQGPRGSLG